MLTVWFQLCKVQQKTKLIFCARSQPSTFWGSSQEGRGLEQHSSGPSKRSALVWLWITGEFIKMHHLLYVSKSLKNLQENKKEIKVVERKEGAQAGFHEKWSKEKGPAALGRHAGTLCVSPADFWSQPLMVVLTLGAPSRQTGQALSSSLELKDFKIHVFSK